MRILAILISTFLVALAVSSCEKKYFKPAAVDPNVPVSFATDILPIMESKCATAGCHSGAIAPNLTKDKCYASLMDGGFVDTLNAEGSLLVVKVQANMPPPSGLPDAEVAKIVNWIKQGAKEN